MSILYTNNIAHNTASNNSVTISGSNLITQGTLYTSGSITASGDISASGNIIANAFVGPITGTVTGTSTGLAGTPSISVTNITASGDINTHGTIVSNGFGNPSTITTNTTVPAGYTMVLFTSRYNSSITINSGINYTISSLADISVLDPSKLNF